MNARTDSVVVEWRPEFRDGACVPVVESMTIGEHRFAVIDPADKKAIGRLVVGYHDHYSAPGAGVKAMQAALREFANPTPPKPDRPAGLYAVVEDGDGVEWVAIETSPRGYSWQRLGCPDTTYAEWDTISAVRVLSEGAVAS